MISKKILLFLSIVLILGIGYTIQKKKSVPSNQSGCSYTNKPLEIKSSQTLISWNEELERLPTQIKEFENKLKIEGSVFNISKNLSQPDSKKTLTLGVDVIFQNISDIDLIFYIPQKIGINTPSPATDAPWYNLSFELFSEGDELVPIWGMAEIQDNSFLGKGFIRLKPKESLCINLKLITHPIYINESTFIQDGKYYLLATYENYSVGSRIEFLETPPSSDPNEFRKWYDSRKVIMDFNAWIGRINSSKINFEIKR